MEEFKYNIGDVIYYQKPLVIGQINQLVVIFKDVNFPENLNPISIVTALGDKIPLVIAVLLHEKEGKLKDKDINELAGKIAFDLSPEVTLEVVSDFFDCNPISLLLERATAVAEKIVGKVTGSKGSQFSSQEETSQKETPSFGNTQ